MPTIQRMEASETMIRGNVDSLVKLVTALDVAGIDLIAEGEVSRVGGRGVRLRESVTSAKMYRADNSELQDARRKFA